MARAHGDSCLCDSPSGKVPSACRDVGSLPAHRPHCFPWHSVRSPAPAQLCHPPAPRPWRSYSPSLCLGSPTRCKAPEIGRGKQLCDALGGVADSVVPVSVQDGVIAHFGCAATRSASILTPKRDRGCERGWRIAPVTIGCRGIRTLSSSPVTSIC